MQNQKGSAYQMNDSYHEEENSEEIAESEKGRFFSFF